MFNYQSALVQWNGLRFSLNDLQKRLSALRLEHLAEIPAEIGVRELLLLALENRWVVEEPSGDLVVQVPPEEAAA